MKSQMSDGLYCLRRNVQFPKHPPCSFQFGHSELKTDDRQWKRRHIKALYWCLREKGNCHSSIVLLKMTSPPSKCLSQSTMAEVKTVIWHWQVIKFIVKNFQNNFFLTYVIFSGVSPLVLSLGSTAATAAAAASRGVYTTYDAVL